MVAPGTYKENIYFKGKAVTVKSSHGPNNTVLDGTRSGPVVHFIFGEWLDSVLQGFTVRNGLAPQGGGIYCDGSSPLVRGNKIMLNEADIGGGVFCTNYAFPEISDNIIYQNVSTFLGAGICTIESTPLVTGNTITGNFGEGIACALYAVDIRFNEITFNQGAGIDLNDSWGHVKGNFISSNEESGIYLWMSDPIVANNILHYNSESGISMDTCDSYAPDILNCTLVSNQADEGGGIFCRDSKPTVVNTILWDNEASTGAEIYIDSLFSTSNMKISYSDVRGGQSHVFLDAGSVLDWGPGMIDAFPEFAYTTTTDFHILYTSPCRDAGDSSVQGTDELDMEGDPRVYDGIVDIGADEFSPHLYNNGELFPGGQVHAHFIGKPGSVFVGVWFSFEVLENPVKTYYGNWYLAPYVFGPVVLPPIPSSGLESLSEYLPLFPSTAYDLPMQGFIGDQLTNLSIIEVRVQ
ncbi:MAG: right-handed parallel beta-helix repeat-containing protein [Planctomycetota bacterium]